MLGIVYLSFKRIVDVDGVDRFTFIVEAQGHIFDPNCEFFNVVIQICENDIALIFLAAKNHLIAEKRATDQGPSFGEIGSGVAPVGYGIRPIVINESAVT